MNFEISRCFFDTCQFTSYELYYMYRVTRMFELFGSSSMFGACVLLDTEDAIVLSELTLPGSSKFDETCSISRRVSVDLLVAILVCAELQAKQKHVKQKAKDAKKSEIEYQDQKPLLLCRRVIRNFVFKYLQRYMWDMMLLVFFHY